MKSLLFNTKRLLWFLVVFMSFHFSIYGQSYEGKYIDKEGKGYLIMKKEGVLYASYLNNPQETYRLLEYTGKEMDKYQYSFYIQNQGGTVSATDLGFSKEGSYIILYIQVLSRGQGYEAKYCKDKNIEGSVQKYFTVTYYTNEPSTFYKLWIENNQDPVIVDGGHSYSDFNIEKGEYRITYECYIDAGLICRKSGYVKIDGTTRIEVPDDIIDNQIEKINIGSLTPPDKLYKNIQSGLVNVIFNGEGTEPFWDIYILENELLYKTTFENKTFRMTSIVFNPNIEIQTLQYFDSNGDTKEIVIKKEPSGDGMTDRTYPYSVFFNNLNGYGDSKLMTDRSEYK